MAKLAEMKFSLNELDEVTEKILAVQLSHYSILTFEGPLGVGKTTLIRGLLRFCGVSEPITSPTFIYVNRYITRNGKVFYHLDLYRVASLDEFLASGFDEYLNEKGVTCLIEWPEVISNLLADESIRPKVCSVVLHFDQASKFLRTIEVFSIFNNLFKK